MRNSVVWDEVKDEALIMRSADGDTAAFEELVRRHQTTFFRVARSIVRNDDAAADAVQSALLKMFSKSDTFKADGTFGGWSYRIVRNEALMHLRRLKRRSEVHIDGIAAPCAADADSPHATLARNELAAMLEIAAERLAPKYREPFELKVVTGMSVLELAEHMGLSEGGVKTRLHRARAQMRQTLLRLHGESIFDFMVA